MSERIIESTDAGAAATGSSRAPRPPRRARIALAHDWLCGYRGGEAVLESIARVCEELGEIDALYTMFDDGRPLSPTIDRLRAAGRIRAAALGTRPGALRIRRWLLPLYPSLVQSLSASLRESHGTKPIDLVVSTSSAAIKGLRPPAGVPHICYCHSPARYIWGQADQYGGRGARARLRVLGLRLFARRFRDWDRETAPHVAEFIANSSHTQRLIREAYGRDATVIHPPARTEFFRPDPVRAREDFWLVVGALEPYKRTDLAIRAAALAKQPLVIAGKGSEREALERLARDLNAPVEFRGRVSDEDLRTLYQTASLLLFPNVEDFGIVAVEALACGLPVVARRAGGAIDIVTDGVTGTLFEEPTPEAITAAAARCPRNHSACRASAERFSERTFEDAICAVLLRRLGSVGNAHGPRDQGPRL